MFKIISLLDKDLWPIPLGEQASPIDVLEKLLLKAQIEHKLDETLPELNYVIGQCLGLIENARLNLMGSRSSEKSSHESMGSKSSGKSVLSLGNFVLPWD